MTLSKWISLCVQKRISLDGEIPGRCFCQSLIQSWGKALALMESHSPPPLHVRWTMLVLSWLAAATEEKPNNVPYVTCARTRNVNPSHPASHNTQEVSKYKHCVLTSICSARTEENENVYSTHEQKAETLEDVRVTFWIPHSFKQLFIYLFLFKELQTQRVCVR